MDAIECILTRRSVREFTEEDIDEKAISEILKAGMYAPSAGDQRPWHFIVIRNRKTLEAVTSFHPHAGMLKKAPAAIAVLADEASQKHKGYWTQDCSAATQNMLLAAHALGLGGVWLGIYPREERVKGLSELLGLPGNVVPLALLAFGHPAVKPRQPDRWDIARVRREKW